LQNQRREAPETRISLQGDDEDQRAAWS